MSFRIIKDGNDAKILDETLGVIVAVVVPGYGAASSKIIVELANRAEKIAADEAKIRTENAGQKLDRES